MSDAKRRKRQTAHWQIRFASTYPTMDLNPEYIKNSENSTVRKQTNQLKNGKQTWTLHHRGYRNSKLEHYSCLISLIIRETEIKQ